VPPAEAEGLPFVPPPADAGLPAAPDGLPAEPQRLYPGRAPVVELVPDPVLPPDQGLPPRNRIPAPADGLPKNVVPPR
jgi:hypothetical protein